MYAINYWSLIKTCKSRILKKVLFWGIHLKDPTLGFIWRAPVLGLIWRAPVLGLIWRALFWDSFEGPLFWDSFEGPLFWDSFEVPLYWDPFEGPLFWDPFEGPPVLGPIWRATVYGASMSIFTGLRARMDELLIPSMNNTRPTDKGASEADIRERSKRVTLSISRDRCIFPRSQYSLVLRTYMKK
jgi:hypothetical protein